jgi:hypothetical protein
MLLCYFSNIGSLSWIDAIVSFGNSKNVMIYEGKSLDISVVTETG